MNNTDKAVKHDEELAKLEAEIVAQSEAEKVEEPVEQAEESVTPVSESAPEETKPSEVEEPEPEAEAKPEEKEDLTEEEVEKLGHKAQKRIRQLNEKLSKARKELETTKRKEKLLEEVDKLDVKGRPEPVQEAPVAREPFPWEPQPEVPEYKELKTEVQQLKQLQYKEKFDRHMERVDSDVKAIESSYAELNPENDMEFDEELSKYLYEGFRRGFNQDNSYRLKTHVDNFMKHRGVNEEKVAEKAKDEVTVKVAKQAAEQAISPTTVPAPKRRSIEERIADAKTPEELEKLEREISRS